VHLHLHGSVVRGEGRPDSDVDLAAQFDRAKVRSMLTEIGLKNRLSDILWGRSGSCRRGALEQEARANFQTRGGACLLKTLAFLRHILTSIELIEQFTSGRSMDEFQADPMRVAGRRAPLEENQ
jgi:predicted nucleotidyltransferase